MPSFDLGEEENRLKPEGRGKAGLLVSVQFSVALPAVSVSLVLASLTYLYLAGQWRMANSLSAVL